MPKTEKFVDKSRLTKTDASKINYAYGRLKAMGEDPTQSFMKKLREMANMFL